MRKNIGYEGLIEELLVQEEKERIGKILEETLSERELTIIKERFGLNTEPKTLEAIAKIFGVSRDRIRQIEFKALRKLRKKWAILSFREIEKIRTDFLNFQKRFEFLEKNVNLFVELAQGIFKKKEEPISLEEQKLYDKLLLPITELELSVRSSKCLREGGIGYLYQLVVKTEEELLCYKNLGKKSLSEIKEILAGLGLALGMRLPEKFFSLPQLKTKRT